MSKLRVRAAALRSPEPDVLEAGGHQWTFPIVLDFTARPTINHSPDTEFSQRISIGGCQAVEGIAAIDLSAPHGSAVSSGSP